MNPIYFSLNFFPRFIIPSFSACSYRKKSSNKIKNYWRTEQPIHYRLERQKRKDRQSDLFEGEYTYRCIVTNDQDGTEKEIIPSAADFRKYTYQAQRFINSFLSSS